MKKFLSALALGMMVTSASAQKTVQGAGFFDNWSIGLVGGGVVPTVQSDYIKDMRGTYGLDLTKQITPGFGLGLEYLVSHNTTGGGNVFDRQNLSLLGKFNLSNLFCGYNGQPRLFEVEAVAGVGWGHDFYPTREGVDANYLTTKYGVNLNFNVGEAKAWTIGIKPAIVYNMNNEGHRMQPSYNVNRSSMEFLVGVTYHFKNSNNGKNYMTLQRAYDQAEVDGLNAKINDLRAQNNDKDATLARKNEEIRNLQQQLNDCRNQKPVVQTQTVTKNTASLEQTVTFRQGKSVVDASQLPNVERVATFLRNHKSATVTIKGYASPEGSAEVNARIAKARAEAVKKILTNKYKIAENRITAEGQGVGNMFSEDDWNRVSICTINDAD